MYAEISPRFLNKNTLIDIGYGEVKYAVSRNLSARTVNKIAEDLRNFNDSLKNIEIEMYDDLVISKDSRLHLEVPVVSDEQGLKYRISGCDNSEMIAYLRKITATQPSVFDTYFEYNGRQARLFQNPTLDLEQMEEKLSQLNK
jgi:hypothetical protein